jgi:hypothetical protein
VGEKRPRYELFYFKLFYFMFLGAPAVSVGGGTGQVAASGGDLNTLEHYRNLCVQETLKNK